MDRARLVGLLALAAAPPALAGFPPSAAEVRSWDNCLAALSSPLRPRKASPRDATERMWLPLTELLLC